MINRFDPATARFLSSLTSNAREFERAEREISSGKRITAPSDSPDQVTPLLQARISLRAGEQIRANLGRIKTEVDTAESAVAAAVKAVERGRVIGLRGANTLASPDTRTVLGNEIAELIETIVNLTRAGVEGRFIFSGDSDLTAPYAFDAAATPLVSAYAGSAATRETMHPSGALFRVSKTAEEIFAAPAAGASVFGALEELRAALLANDQAGIESGLANLGTAATHLNNVHASYGAIQNKVESALNEASATEARLTEQIGSIEDADMAASALALSDARFHREATLAVRSQGPRRTLFDFIA